jgi:hypothetical protein
MDTKYLKNLVGKFSKVNKEDSLLYVSYGISALSVMYMFYRTQLSAIMLAAGVALMLYSLTSECSVSLIAGALAGLIAVQYSRRNGAEGFSNEEEEDAVEEEEEKVTKKAKKATKKAEDKAPPPDNGDRAEFFQLGKKYKGPKEEDDKEFHLDAGTTFMNAYKSLKPDQVAAMTKDTQELMQTQKQLMSTLQTLKPLIQDGKEMMNMFQGYFGAGQMSAN